MNKKVIPPVSSYNYSGVVRLYQPNFRCDESVQKNNCVSCCKDNDKQETVREDDAAERRNRATYTK